MQNPQEQQLLAHAKQRATIAKSMVDAVSGFISSITLRVRAYRSAIRKARDADRITEVRQRITKH